MKQKVIFTESPYGEKIKSLLTNFGPKSPEARDGKQYCVAYYKNPDDLLATETADFSKLSDAMFSINTRLN